MQRSLVLFLCGAAAVTVIGCIQAPYKELIYNNPFIEDNLASGHAAASVEGGTFTSKGWRSGQDGLLTYDLPKMTQGEVILEVSGLSRVASDSVFLSLWSPADSKYADPFITKNPYLITLSTLNYIKHPEASFSFLWTLKNFPAGTTEDVMYSDQKPEANYQEIKESTAVSVYPDEFHTIRIVWMNGQARFYFDGDLEVEHSYAPLVFNADALRLAIGNAPGFEGYDLPGLTVRKVVITFPGM
ncbi:MAG: hypothetical protein GC154_10285 [bacterium]|nr:hypothetical protein [bacterium]